MEVQIRVGLNSGEVVVRAIGNDLHMDYSAIGQTTHLAARMEQLAAREYSPDRRDAAAGRGAGQVMALGPVPVKGLAEPVEVFELVGASALRRRLQVAAARGLTRFVGRQPELAALQQALERAWGGAWAGGSPRWRGRRGKSRLVYEIIHSHHTQGWLVLESASVSYGKATPYFPVLDLLKRYTQSKIATKPVPFGPGSLAKSGSWTRRCRNPPGPRGCWTSYRGPSICAPWTRHSAATASRRPSGACSYVKARCSRCSSCARICTGSTGRRRCSIRLIESLPTARLLLLVNYRPEYQHGWGSKTTTRNCVRPVATRECQAFLHALLGDDPSLAPLTRLLTPALAAIPSSWRECAHPGGDAGAGRGTRRRAHATARHLQVPATVQAVLAARIDRLSAEEKRLLQTAAVIGTEVPFPCCKLSAHCPRTSCIVVWRTCRPRSSTRPACFPNRPNLRARPDPRGGVRESAPGATAPLYARIVEASGRSTRPPDRTGRTAGYHAVRGEVWEKALRYSRQAGARALARSANQEGVTFLEGALAAFQHLPEQPSAVRRRRGLPLTLREALLRLGALARLSVLLQEAVA